MYTKTTSEDRVWATNAFGIACAAGFWGDTESAAPQLLKGGRLDYLVFDYLAEIHPSIRAGARLARLDGGHAHDFVSRVMAPGRTFDVPDCTHRPPLIALAHGRSGDKGNHANIGILAREPEYAPYIEAALRADTHCTPRPSSTA